LGTSSSASRNVRKLDRLLCGSSLDLRGAIPTFIHISDGKLYDVNVLDLLVTEPAPST
jgi:hypothetical protein